MKHSLSVFTLVALATAGAVGWVLLASKRTFAQDVAVQGMSDTARQQIIDVINLKRAFTPAQQKMESSLVLAADAAAGDRVAASAAAIAGTVPAELDTLVTIDIHGTVSGALLDAIGSANGVVIDQSEAWGIVRASVPLGAVAAIAAIDEVTSIQSAAQYMLNSGGLTSQGYISHAANQVFNMGIDGANVTVGVLSDSALPLRIAALEASGDLPADTQVLPGQQGPVTGTDEGAAMMEIVHDIAPGARLIFATAANGVASFANNILALQAAGATVIVDDYTYFNEGAFQDGPIAQAVNQVTTAGVVYFSSAANSGNLTLGTSGTWEGDFLENGVVGPPVNGVEAGMIHNFGSVAVPQNYNVLTATSRFISLKWSDPLGGSTNDYDLFILDSTGTTIKALSISSQTGSQEPYEFVQLGINCGTPSASGYCPVVGDRIVVVRFSGNARALRIDTHRGRLSIATTGSTFGHNAGSNTVSTAATYWNSAKTGTRAFTGPTNPNEVFSSDGPRKIFFNPDGTPITPGNFLFATNGGVTLTKPDITAADGVSTKTPGFLPFFGTSAAAPHAAGVAALILSARPGYRPAQVLAAMKATALDSMAPGIDRDSGAGIATAFAAVEYALTH